VHLTQARGLVQESDGGQLISGGDQGDAGRPKGRWVIKFNPKMLQVLFYLKLETRPARVSVYMSLMVLLRVSDAEFAVNSERARVRK